MKHGAQQGFTLVELMIAVAIIGILAGVAIPSYRQYIIKSNRAAAQAFMLAVANKEEQYILDAKEYATASTITAIGTTLNVAVPPEVSKYYAMSINNIGSNPRTYSIVADPIAGTAQAADGTLALDNTGTKTPAGKW